MPSRRKTRATRYELPKNLELKRIISLRDASDVSAQSVDSLKRNHPDKIVKLGPRLYGMRLADALLLGPEPTA